MKTNRELDELIYKLFHNVDEIPPPQEYVDFSSRSVEYVDQVPNYTESVNNALTLIRDIPVSIEAFHVLEDNGLQILWSVVLHVLGKSTVTVKDTLSMAICLAWLAYKGHSNAGDS